MPNSGFALKHIYPSEQGLHIVHYSTSEAAAAYADAKSKGMNVRLDGVVMTWCFYNPRSPHPIPISQEHRHRISRGRSAQLQLRRITGAVLGRRLARAERAARLLHERK